MKATIGGTYAVKFVDEEYYFLPLKAPIHNLGFNQPLF
jgi:hypothetical protein